MDELTRYIINNYSSLMTIQENMAWRYFIFKEKGEVNLANDIKDKYSRNGILELIQKGEEEFFKRVKDRILNEHTNEVHLNFCPKCGQLIRTPKAKQCFNCKHDWHNE